MTLQKMASTHNQGITNYLNKHKVKTIPDQVAKTDTVKNGKPCNFQSSTESIKSRILKRKPPPVIRGKITINHLPDEVLLKIFEFLDAGSLLFTASVCKFWQGLANDNALWIKICQTYANTERHRTVSPDKKLPLSYWKSLCIHRCTNERNKNLLKFLQMKKKNSYNGLPENTVKCLKKYGIYYQLSIKDSNGRCHDIKSSEIFYHKMSVCVRWYDLQTAVSLRNVRNLNIFSCNPLFFDKTGKVVANSPYQRSLLTERQFKWEDWKKENKPIKEDENIQLYKLSSNILIATWKADGELAFIVLGLHQHRLIHKCLYGTSLSQWVPPEHIVIEDDIDPSYGLHHYNCTVELRNMRQSIWSQQFQAIECKQHEIVNNKCPLVLRRSDQVVDRLPLDKGIALPWKTDLFKGIIKNVCWLDITLLDERNTVFWTISSPIHTCMIDTTKSVAMDFEYKNESKLEMRLTEDDVEVVLQLNEMDDGTTFLTHLELQVDVEMIDSWFGTNYKQPESDKKHEQSKSKKNVKFK